MTTRLPKLDLAPAIRGLIPLLAIMPALLFGTTPPERFQLMLKGALSYQDSPRDLIMDMERMDGIWGAVYGVARDYNMAFHQGSMADVRESEGTLAFALGMNYTGDPWIPGGEGRYHVTLRIAGDDTVSGEFTGEFLGKAVAGGISGTRDQPTLAAGHRPLKSGEHPRLLFNPDEVPALRGKFKTPFGQAARQRMEARGSLPDLGLLYQMTGDKAYVEKGLETARRFILRGHQDRAAFRPLATIAERVEELALYYDLCHDALPEEFRISYRAFVANLGFQVYFAPGSIARTNWHVVSNHVADFYAGMTLSALVLFDSPAEAPAPPSRPFLEEVLPPAPASFVPAKGVPVVDLRPGRSPERWLHTGFLRQVTPDDPREVFYGLEKIRAEPGMDVRVGEFTLGFREQDSRLLVAENDPHGGLRTGEILEADSASRLNEPFTLVAYTVLRVGEPGLYKVNSPSSLANLMQVGLGGEMLADGQVVRLEPGLYPLVAKVQWRMRWGHLAPHLSKATGEDLENWQAKLADRRDRYETSQQQFQNQRAIWERTGGDPVHYRLLRLTRFTSALHNEHAVGRGGFQGEISHYSLEAMLTHARLWPSWRKVMGWDITPGNEYAHYLPRKIIGGPQDINGTTRIGRDFFPALFPAVRPEWQPEVLTRWRQYLDMSGPEDYAKLLAADPVRTFVNYPTDMAPAPIGTKLPRFWTCPDFGYFAFRSGWDDDAFIAQVFLKSRGIGGWSAPNAATYRLRGLGVDWAKGPDDRVRRRQQENVVWLPTAELNEWGRANALHTRLDGQILLVSARMDDVYEREGRLTGTRYGNVQRVATGDNVPEASGIGGQRAFGFDFSGKSGAPALYAIVDRIDGAGEHQRLWLHQPPLSTGKTVADVVETGGEGDFVIRPAGEGPTLRGVFVHPAKPEIRTEPMKFSYVKTFGHNRGETLGVDVNALSVPGEDHFFFVGTVAPGPHPEIKVTGSGLDAVVTVGGRVIRYDGGNIVFE